MMQMARRLWTKQKWINLLMSGCLTLIMVAFVGFWLVDFSQEEVVVAVLDTGVNAAHPLLSGKVSHGYDFINFRTNTDDTVGHGTHVAGIIATIAPDVEILPIRVIDDQDRVRRTWLAILYAVVKGADVVNMSYAEHYNFATDLTIRLARSKGVVFVASSGNLGIEDVFYPARYKGVYSVAGWDENNHRIFGNYGHQVHYAAPGVRIRSAAKDGGYTVKSGTSMAAGYLSGVVAYLQQQIPVQNTKQLEQQLNEIALTVDGNEPSSSRSGAQSLSLQYKLIHLSNLHHPLFEHGTDHFFSPSSLALVES